MKLRTLLSLLILPFAAGCQDSSGGAPAADKGIAKTVAAPELKELRIALVPSDDAQEMISQFDKLRAYLEKSLGMPVTVSKVTSYAACIEAMKKKRIEAAWFGPTSYVLAEQEAQAEAFLVSQDTKGVTSYHSIFLVPANSPIKSLDDLKGKKIGLVEASSTSGGLIPSYLVQKHANTPIDKFATVSFLGSHDAVVNAIKDGSMDAGATNNLTIDRLVEEKKLGKDDLRVIEQSKELPGSPLAYRSDLAPETKQKIKDALIASSKALGTYKIAGFGEIAGFKEVKPADYQMIRDIAKELGLTRDQLLK